MSRAVTERDFRAPEFRDANPEDYEFRADGKIVRKDRWETGIHQIAGVLGMSRGGFEVKQIVDAVDALVGNWTQVSLESFDPDDFPACERIDVRLCDGSMLIGLVRKELNSGTRKHEPIQHQYVWEKHGSIMRFAVHSFGTGIVEWRESVEPEFVEVKEA